MDRRRFLVSGAAVCACRLWAADGVAAAGDGGAARTSASPSPAGPVDAGDVRVFAAEAVFDGWAASSGFFIVHHGNRLYAPSAVCTHQGAPLAVSGRKILCARHGSLFDLEGTVRKGPARIPLPRFRIALDERGHVIVDTSMAIPFEKWRDPGAYLDLPG